MQLSNLGVCHSPASAKPKAQEVAESPAGPEADGHANFSNLAGPSGPFPDKDDWPSSGPQVAQTHKGQSKWTTSLGSQPCRRELYLTV